MCVCVCVGMSAYYCANEIEWVRELCVCVCVCVCVCELTQHSFLLQRDLQQKL